MQYPIIDNIIKAYQKNDWSGLQITPETENLYNGANNELFPLFLPAGTTVTVSCNTSVTAQINYYNADKERIDYWGLNPSGDRKFRIFNLLADTYYFEFRVTDASEYMITTNGNYNDYIPYKAVSNIGNKLRLPILKCFPLYDALVRAAAGAQTEDDTEILQHYLTPLGIGGI